MSIYENFPYQDVDNLNLDWILKKVKEASQIADEYEQRLSDVEAEEVNLRNDVGDLQQRASTDEGLISGLDGRVVQLETDLPGKQDKITGTNTTDKIVVGDGSTGAEFSDITAHDCFRRNSGTAGAADGEVPEFYTDPADGLIMKKSGVNSAEITKKAAAATFTGNGGTLVVSNGDGTVTNSSKNVTNVLENTAILSAADGDPIVSDGAGGIKVGSGGGGGGNLYTVNAVIRNVGVATPFNIRLNIVIYTSANIPLSDGGMRYDNFIATFFDYAAVSGYTQLTNITNFTANRTADSNTGFKPASYIRLQDRAKLIAQFDDAETTFNLTDVNNVKITYHANKF